MTYWCIEHLRRLPEEIDAPNSALARALVAWSLVRERQEREARSE